MKKKPSARKKSARAAKQQPRGNATPASRNKQAAAKLAPGRKLLVSAIIPARNEEKDLPDALDSLLAQSYPHFEAIVVNDGSTDGTRRVAESYARRDKRIKVINYPKGHSAAFARNRGIEKSRGDIITLHDADQVADRRYMEELVRHFTSGSGIDGVANKVLAYPPRNFIAKCIAAQRSVTWDTNQAQTVPVTGQTPIGMGTYSRLAMDALIGFNEDIFYFEDTDLAQRFHAAGFKAVYEPKAIEYHKDPSTLPETLRQSRWFGRGIGLRLRLYGELKPLAAPLYSLVVALAAAGAIAASALGGSQLASALAWTLAGLLVPLAAYALRLSIKSGDPIHSFGFALLFLLSNLVKFRWAMQTAFFGK